MLAGKPPRPPTPAQLKEVDARIGIARIITGRTAEGHDFYAYVNLRPSTYDEFCRKINAGEKIDVEKFGTVLHKGYGKEPSEDVKRHMEEQYGLDHNFAQNLAEALRQELEKGPPEQK